MGQLGTALATLPHPATENVPSLGDLVSADFADFLGCILGGKMAFLRQV